MEVPPVTETIQHPPSECALCGRGLDDAGFRAETGLYVLDIERREQAEGLLGLAPRHTKHVYGSIAGDCGHVNRRAPGRCKDDPLWAVALSEWCLVGPMLASLLVCLSHRMRLSRRLIREFLKDWFGLTLSTSLINRCLHEAGRAVEPLEEQLVDELQQEILAHVDETPWKEWGQLLWLRVISTSTVCLYLIGYRSGELLSQVFSDAYRGRLMSDGYAVYRRFKNRLRCWAHLLRKVKFLEGCLSLEAQRFGQECRVLLETLMEAVYRAREGPPVEPTPCYAGQLQAFRRCCERYREASHAPTRALAREFLHDREAIFRVLAHPCLPFTNNEAERALRHWVIVRRITQGTRTAQGTRALALLASVIETCRKRNILPWPYLATVIAERRKGNQAPALPACA